MKTNQENIIQLANDIMNDFRDNSKDVYEDGYRLMKQSSRLGILKTELEFDVAIKIIKDSIELLRKEYKEELFTISNLGMYYTLTSLYSRD